MLMFHSQYGRTQMNSFSSLHNVMAHRYACEKFFHSILSKKFAVKTSNNLVGYSEMF
jgi:hypothetical protein